MTTIAFPPHPIEVNTPRGHADVMWITDYGQESYVYLTVAQCGTGEFWTYKNTEVTLRWDESTGLGRKPDPVMSASPSPYNTYFGGYQYYKFDIGSGNPT